MTNSVLLQDQKGCPSGLQEKPIIQMDPKVGDVDLSTFETISSEGLTALELSIQGAHCSGCVSKIERGLTSMSGVKAARLNLTTARLSVSWDDAHQSSSAIVSKITDLGFGATPFQHSEVELTQQRVQKKLLRYIAVSGFAAMNVMLLSISVWSGGGEMSSDTRHLFHWLSAFIALPTIAYAGRAFFTPALQALRKKQTNMDVPISLALILASGLSFYETVNGHQDVYFDAAVMLLFLLLIGRYLDARLRLKTGEAARRLTAMQVSTATRVLSDGRQETLPAQSVKIGDKILIPKGQRIPIDCQILSGASEIDAQIATGETVFQKVASGDFLLSGTINLSAPLTARVTSNLENSFLSEITQLVEIGEQTKSRFVRIADRAARAYVPIVHSLAAMTFIGWYLLSGDLRTASLNAIAVLIITCPCALGLAVPAVHAVAASKLFDRGIFARSGDALERLAKINHVVFDKTGTLTKGQFTLLYPEGFAAEPLGLAGALAAYSNHPLSQALKAYARPTELINVIEKTGQGLSAKYKGTVIKLGSAEFVGAESSTIAQSSVWFRQGDQIPIQFEFRDELREDARATVQLLQSMALSQEMLTGDNDITAKEIAEQLGLDIWQANVTPRQKMQIIEQCGLADKRPLMVGDGLNDAPALAAATASVSFSSASDISRTASDIIVQNDKLLNLPVAISTARSAQKRVIENLSLAVIYNMCAIPLAVLGWVNPLIAALAMSGSSLIVTLNALRVRTK